MEEVFWRVYHATPRPTGHLSTDLDDGGLGYRSAGSGRSRPNLAVCAAAKVPLRRDGSQIHLRLPPDTLYLILGTAQK